MFKVGDKVICIQGTDKPGLITGERYTVSGIWNINVSLKEVDRCIYGSPYYGNYRFILDIKEQRKRKILKCLK